MTKSRRLLFDTGRVAKPLGTGETGKGDESCGLGTGKGTIDFVDWNNEP